MVNTFLDSENLSYEKAKYIFLPIPYEKTTSFLKGTANAPEEIIKNSYSLELFDPETGKIYSDEDFYTLKSVDFNAADNEKISLGKIEERVKEEYRESKHLISIGGEHTITLPIVRAIKEIKGDFSIIFFDAHYDMRDSYEGSKFSHACVMRRIYEEGFDITGIGMRAGSIEDFEFSQKREIETFALTNFDKRKFEERLNKIGEKIYISVDFDFFDPSILPTVGTPEIEGGTLKEYKQVLRIIEKGGKNIVGMDFTEFLPVRNLPQYSYIASSIIFKTLNILF